MTITYSVLFLNQLNNYKINNIRYYKIIQKIIIAFATDKVGGLQGRNKSSYPGRSYIRTPSYLGNSTLVKDHNLYHYHIGIPEYNIANRGFGDYTSEYILHYKNNMPDSVTFLEINKHPAFTLPDINSNAFIIAK